MDTNQREEEQTKAGAQSSNGPFPSHKLSVASHHGSPSEEKKSFAQPPSLSLPKGGGAIRDMGEKFEVNPTNGTASFSVPIALSPGRSGFGPQLSLSYNSGSGNGPFGLGWALSLPSIARKTEKGLPRYNDAEDSDIFILAGSEDLVPVYDWDGKKWTKNPQTLAWNGANYSVQRYRPRVEGLFSRIEKWAAPSGDVFWKTVTKDNVTSVFGKDPFGTDSESRLSDPSDGSRIFKWFLAESYDDKGNWVVYQYVSEDSKGVDLSQAHEANRLDQDRKAQRYLKNIFYGNQVSRLVQSDPTQAQWMFHAVLDYGEGQYSENPPDSDGNVFAQASAAPPTNAHWPVRSDPFSTFRPCFEVRTYRLCQRVLMFHLFDELGVNPCLVKSTEFSYNPDPALTTMVSVVQNGFTWQVAGGNYLKKSMPPLRLAFSEPVIDPDLHFVDAGSLDNLPEGLNWKDYEWVDLDSEGLSGILAKRGDGWYYKRNISALPDGQPDGSGSFQAQFAPLERVSSRAVLSPSDTQILDLAGDGRKSLVHFRKPVPGYMERDEDGDWKPFIPFASNPNIDWNDPNLRMVDLNGDGFADILVSEDEAFRWYPSFAKGGFGEARTIPKPFDEDEGPALVFADRTQMIFLADMSGDGLTDIVRIRYGEVCYWPNLGYGRFGAKVAMDGSPAFESHESFDPRRIKLADIDGSGTTDLIYLGNDQLQFWFNQAGNSFGPAQTIGQFPDADSLSTVMAVDLLGIGTSCLVWSSSLPEDAGRPLRYIDLMSSRKPHLLTSVDNQMGARRVITYAPSTQFYLEDKYQGVPWVTRLPFPVQLVERVDNYDLISHNRYVTRFAYHHGYYDGVEREFRGFGMVEQWDTEEIGALSTDGNLPSGDNFDSASNVPPVHTKTWFHTGAYFGRQRIDPYLASEYFKGDALAWAPPATPLPQGTTLPDGTTLPALSGTLAAEDREACRALKGKILRQETYADDGSPQAANPYSVVDNAYAVEMFQPILGSHHPGLEPPHGIFYSHEGESVSYHYERNPADPRIGHRFSLQVDTYGNILKTLTVGYGRRTGQADPDLAAEDQAKQSQVWMTYTEDDFTKPLDDASNYRAPLPCETRGYELTGFTPSNTGGPFVSNDFTANQFTPLASATEIPFEQTADPTKPEKRMISRTRHLFRKDDLSGPCPFGTLESMALPYQNYQMAFTFGLASQVYQNPAMPSQLTDALGAFIGPSGAYVPDANSLDGGDPAPHAFSSADGNLWVPSGKVFYSPNSADTAAQESSFASSRFFLPVRFQDPFGNITTVTYDPHNLLPQETRDPLGNRVTVGERDTAGNLTKNGNDYRLLQPALLMDPNRNRSAASFDTLGLVVGSALMGKPEENLGDSLAGFTADLTDSVVSSHLLDPLANPGEILQQATLRLVYDLFAFQRTQSAPQPSPNVAYTLARETHVSDLAQGQTTGFQHVFTYTDGMGQEIQKKVQAEAGPLDLSNPSSPVVDPRWVGTGWVVLNNKGKPVRQYEPFFSRIPQFEYAPQTGVSPVIFYDPLERMVATLNPNQSYLKVAFTAWKTAYWDMNDTVLTADPSTDPDVGAYFSRIPTADYLPSWYTQRQPAGGMSAGEQAAAVKTAAHAGTPALEYLDSLGRAFLNVEDDGTDSHGNPQKFPTRVELDVLGNQLSTLDALGREVSSFDWNLLGKKIHQSNMEAGERWNLSDAMEKPLYAWNSRLYRFRQVHDALHRPLQFWISQGGGQECLLQYIVYGETTANALSLNLLGKAYQSFDQAGLLTSEAYDFKGNLLSGNRQFALNYKIPPGLPCAVDWKNSQNGTQDPNTLLEKVAGSSQVETFHFSSAYDALNRAVLLTAPDGSLIQPVFNKANLLESMNFGPRGAATAPFLTQLNYDSKGQRTLCTYANGAQTTYSYDPLTFRLSELKTTRPTPGTTTGATDLLQDLVYFHDPVGNITQIDDNAQQTLYYNNAKAAPSGLYTYDPLYRLLQAQGREHAGQNQAFTAYDNWDDASDLSLPQPGDGNAMVAYTETYAYDAAGNFTGIGHQGAVNWTRNYQYAEPSLLEGGKVSNRLSNTSIQGSAFTYAYTYDAQGNMLAMPHLPLMQWGGLDQLQATARQAVSSGNTPETTYYAYDAGGMRARKVTEGQASSGQPPVRTKERLVIAGFEVYREYGPDGTAILLERQSLGVMDDKRRVALVETQTVNAGAAVPSPTPLPRFQMDDHHGTSRLELDGTSQIISYEEYFPFGGTSYQAVTSAMEVPAKRYRYTGRERDEESGFYHHTARYYIPWLGRWTACDPAGQADGPNLYVYCRNNPVRYKDPGGKQPLPPFPIPGHTPFNFVAEGPALRNWQAAAQRVLEARFHGGNLANNIRLYEQYIGTLPHGSNRAAGTAVNYARRTFNALRQAFYRAEAANPSFSYTAQQLARMRGGSAPIPGVQLHHMEHLAVRPERALDEANVLITRGHASSPGLGHGTLHNSPGARRLAAFEEGGAEAQRLARTEAVVNDVRRVDQAVTEVAEVTRVASTTSRVTRVVAGVTRVTAPIVRAAAPVVRVAAPVVRVAAPVVRVAGRVAGPLAVAGSVYELATARNTDQRVDAGIGLVGNTLLLSKNPVAMAAGGGVLAGQAIEHTLHVSDYAASAGMTVNEFARSHGAGETTSLVLGGVATVLVTPSAIGYAFMDHFFGGH